MNRTSLAVALWFLSPFTSCLADDSISGIYSSAHRIKGHPLGNVPFGSRIEIRKLDSSHARVQITLNEATAGSSCGGGINGIAELAENRLLLEKKDGDDICRVEILVDKLGAGVVREESCSAFHGVGCSFEEAASRLPRSKVITTKEKRYSSGGS